MTAALEHPLGPNTVADWRTADHPDDGRRLELILGHFFMSPSPGGPHQYATGALYRALWEAVTAADRKDLHVVLGVGVEISTPWRTALIPDVAVLNVRPTETSFPPEALVLAVEVWSPGNSRSERETKIAAYAAAGVEFLWIVEPGRNGPVQFRAYRLVNGSYREEASGGTGAVLISVPGPVLISIDTAELTL